MHEIIPSTEASTFEDKNGSSEARPKAEIRNLWCVFPNAMTSIKDANRDEQDIYDRDQNRPEQKSEDGIKEGRNSQETAADAPSPVTADTIDVMVSYGQDRCMVWRRWITMLPPTQSMAAVPTIDISFSTVGIAMTSQRPNARTLLRVAALLKYRPKSSSLALGPKQNRPTSMGD